MAFRPLSHKDLRDSDVLRIYPPSIMRPGVHEEYAEPLEKRLIAHLGRSGLHTRGIARTWFAQGFPRC